MQTEIRIINTLRAENEKVLNFIQEFQSKNDYNPRFLDEYNNKFNAEFAYFINSNNFSNEIKETFLTN